MGTRLNGAMTISALVALLVYICLRHLHPWQVNAFKEIVIVASGQEYTSRAASIAREAVWESTKGSQIDGWLFPVDSFSQKAIAVQQFLSLPGEVTTTNLTDAIAVIINESNDPLPELHESNLAMSVFVLDAGSFLDLWSTLVDIPSVAIWSQQDMDDEVALELFASFMAILALVVTLISLYIYFWCRAPERSSNMVVLALPTHAFRNGDWQDVCVICLEDFDNTSVIMTLPCGHEFHSSCISLWLLGHRNVCPICLKKVTEESIRLMV